MKVWRLTRAPFANAPFDGTGPARGGGRWNSRGVRLAYASSSRALAILEVLVHVTRANAPADYVFIEADLPDDAVEELDITRLPGDWRAEPPPAPLRTIGDSWVRNNTSVALRVPSALVPEEYNFLVNPAHGRFKDLRIVGAPHLAILDPRLLR